MNLTPEEKEVGKQNFLEATGATRRDFLKGTVLGGAATGATLGSLYFNYGAIKNDRLRVGIIGTGDEGGVLIGALNPDYIDVVAIADIRPYNIHRAFYGDLSSDGTKAARPGLCDIYGWKDQTEGEEHVKIYCQEKGQTYDALLKDPKVEAVIIALPLWLHDIAAIKAMRAGKHVLTEKLMAHSVWQCKEMARVAGETKKILATGHQRHYSVLYDNAVSQISSGLIGDVHAIRAQWHRDNLPGSDSWQPPLPTEKIMTPEEFANLEREAKKTGGDKAVGTLRNEYRLLRELHAWSKQRDQSKAAEAEKWALKVEQKRQQLEDAVVDAAGYGYQDTTLSNGYKRSALEELIRWRLWDRTGGGLMAELGSHQLDASSIFISAQREGHQKVMPLSVTGVGHRSLFPLDRDVDDHVYTIFEYPGLKYYKDGPGGEVADSQQKIIVTYSSINGNGYGGYGEVVLGTQGTLILDREKDAYLFKKSETQTKISVIPGKGGAAMDTYETGGGGGAAIAAAATPGDVSRGYREEIEHWAWCIRNPAPENVPKCHPKVAMADAVIALTSNIAMRENRKIEFKPEWFDIESDETPEGKQPRKLSELG